MAQLTKEIAALQGMEDVGGAVAAAVAAKQNQLAEIRATQRARKDCWEQLRPLEQKERKKLKALERIDSDLADVDRREKALADERAAIHDRKAALELELAGLVAEIAQTKASAGPAGPPAAVRGSRLHVVPMSPGLTHVAVVAGRCAAP